MNQYFDGVLAELRARLKLDDLPDTLLMMCSNDEPFRDFVRHRDPSFRNQYVSGETYKDIHAIRSARTA